MTTRKDTPKKRHPTDKQALMLARLRDKGLGLAPVVEGGRVVRSKAPGRTIPARGGRTATTAPQGSSGAITRQDDSKPAERHTAGSTFEVVIPAPCPFLNANRDKSLHWAPKAERIRAWRRTANMSASVVKLPKGLARVQIDAYVIKPRANNSDPANWAPTAKAVVDGLVDYGLIPDDNRLILDGPFMRDGGKGSNALRVVITVLPSQLFEPS